MDRTYWEKIAPDYNEEIFDVLHNDKRAIIRAAIKELRGKDKTVIDAGCAIGKWLPVLSPLFKKVYAADISAKNLVIARKHNPHYTNIEYRRVDMSGKKISLPKADVAVCINAVLTDSLPKRNRFFHNLSSCIKKKGSLILVVPSLESWMFTHIVQNKWKIDANLFTNKLSGKEGLKKYNNMRQGNLDIDHVPTKHYLEEELVLLLDQEGLKMQKLQKIEYEWTTEFIDPPDWLNEPKPWDWMCVAERQ